MSIEYQIGEQAYRVNVNGATGEMCQVTLEPVGDEEQADPQTLEAQLIPVEANTYLFVVHGNHYLAHVVAGPDAHHVNVGGQNFTVIPPEQLERRRRAGTSIDPHDHVTPPMPGQVISILVEVGDRVDKGQTVVIISAMKMESNLNAPHAGTVTAIHTSVGAQVNPGDILVDIEEDEDA